MARILILIIIGFILVKILKRMIASADSKSSAKEKMPAAEEKMIQCAKCGCHVPISESRHENNQLTCNNPECQP